MQVTRERSWNETISNIYIAQDPKATCRDITLQVTEDCCLNCTYCYQINKTHKMMTVETAKKCLNLLFQMYDEDNSDKIINHHTYGLVINFIGGEPFMNIDTIEYATKYFLDECLRRNHIWLTNSRFNISTNGMLYFTPKVLNYIKQFHNFLSLNISIDGPQELHDACRIDYQNNGSFEAAMKAFHYHQMHYEKNMPTKITISPENLKYVDKIIDFFIQEHVSSITGGPIFEHLWTIEEAKLYYQQLKYIANKLLSYPEIAADGLFQENTNRPLGPFEDSNWCGGTGAMLAFDPDGLAYPCLRYMPSSLGKAQKPLVIGDYNGLYKNAEQKKIKSDLESITRSSQSTEECMNCSIAAGCAWCSGWNYQCYGTCNKRCTNICWMHRASSLANVYFWNKYYKIHNSDKRYPVYLARPFVLQLINEEEYQYLINLSLGG